MKKVVTWVLLVVLVGLAGCSSTSPEYTLNVTVSPTGSGTVSASPSGGKYPRGTQVLLTATPAPVSGYKFIGWEDEGGNLFSGTPLIVAMYANVKLVAVFTDKTFAVPTVPITPSQATNQTTTTTTSTTNNTVPTVPVSPLPVPTPNHSTTLTPEPTPSLPLTFVIELRAIGTMSGSHRYLTISLNGSVTYIKEEGNRIIIPPAFGTRTTNTGQLTETELNSLLEIINACQFDAGGNIAAGTRTRDAGVLTTIYLFSRTKTITSNIQPLYPEVTKLPDVPGPVKTLFYQLWYIAENRTTEVTQEKIY